MTRRRKKGFEERHPFVFLATLPVSLPLAVASDMKKQKKGATKKKKESRKKVRSRVKYFGAAVKMKTHPMFPGVFSFVVTPADGLSVHPVKRETG